MLFAEFAKKAKAIFSQVKWSQEQLANGMLVEWDGEELSKSSVIYLVTPDGYKSPLPDGQYKTKEGVLFVITDGLVSSVENNSTVPAKSATSEPIKQAQSAHIEDSPIQEDEKSNIQTMSEKKKEELKQASTTTAIPDDTTKTAPASDETDAEDTDEVKSIGDQITAALAPVLAALKVIQDSLSTTTEMAKQTESKLSKVDEIVKVIASESAPEKKETKEIKNPFRKEKKDLTETRAFQIMQSLVTPKN